MCNIYQDGASSLDDSNLERSGYAHSESGPCNVPDKPSSEIWNIDAAVSEEPICVDCCSSKDITKQAVNDRDGCIIRVYCWDCWTERFILY